MPRRTLAATAKSVSNFLSDLCVTTVQSAAEEGLIIRVIGAVAVRIHTGDLTGLHARLARKSASGEEFSDLDYITYGKTRSNVEKLLERLGYTPDRAAQLLGLWAGRAVYVTPERQYHADVFFDKLEMCHTVNFAGRLEKDSPTIPLADLLLEKMQIVQINEKDLKDCTALLVGHEIGSGDDELINAPHIARSLANDWGFWYTVTTNLKKLRNYLGKLDVTPKEQATVEAKIDRLLQAINEEPKTSTWEKRAKTGTSKKWYRDVEEIG